MTSAAIQLTDVTVQHDDNVIFKNLSLDVPNHKITAIMGPSGIGKTSILRILSNQVNPLQGQVTFYGNSRDSLSKAEKKALQLNMGFLFQNSALLLNLSVYENIALPLRYHYNLPESIIREVVAMKLHAVNLDNTEELYPEQLSGGMARRVALARCIALDPSLIFCDEPFTGQDPINASTIANLIQRLNKNLQATTVIISHEVALILSLADHIYLLNGTGIIRHGSPAEICTNPCAFTKKFIGEENISYYKKGKKQNDSN